jgi:VCBS repeat-containing protein
MTTYNGGNGKDTINGGSGNDIIHGGNGTDTLNGGAGNDQIYGDNGSDDITGGGGDDLIDGGNGPDTAYYSGLIDDYSFFTSAGYLNILHLGGAGADGHDQVINVERLVFADRVINIGSGKNVPVAGDDHVFTNEDAGTVSSGAAGVLSNDFDFDGDPLHVTGGVFTGTYGTLTLNANGTYSYALFASDQALAQGENVQDSFNYTVTDNDGSDTGKLVFHIAGVNDAPTANPDAITAGENDVVLINVLANDSDIDHGAVLTVTAASAPAGQGSASVVGNQVRFDPGADFDYLDEGESAVVVVQYSIADEHGAPSLSTVTITVEGHADAGAVITGTDNGETLTGTVGDDTIDALGGDDTVFGLAGADLIHGGTGDDILLGGGGNDQLFGDAGNDNLIGENGNDQLSGGDGFDSLDGGAGNDVLDGGNDGDQLSGGDGNDQLLGQAGNDVLLGESGNDQLSGGDGDDTLDGGDGDDTLNGGDGNDALAGGLGANVLNGGLGDDLIVADSSGGAQTIDGGGGNDTIRDYYRSSASTITTGSGSDTIELAHADVGTAAITVTDFTPGAGGDIFRIEGDDGSLLSLLSGWDGSSNPFGQGFLRLQQSGADTLLQWDQDGAVGGAHWETLAILQNTVAGNFTDANFVPGYPPDGSAPAGQTITGTNAGQTLTGTIGDDTINALGGNDVVFGRAGADLIFGGDGLDNLNGEGGNDVIEGGNDADQISGGDGNDQLFGQAGNDFVVGDNGNDQLSGGDGSDNLSGDAGNDVISGGNDDDFLSGGQGDDTLDGGDGNDVLSGGLGANVLNGGLGDDQIVADSSEGAQTIDGGDGNDSIRDYYRTFASTITTGLGSDTIELAHADIGTAAVTVTDFTPGAGGDMFRLEGDDGSLLSLLSGWDSSSNPFDTGFLRLQQSGADTLFQWDRDGAAGGSDWETLAILQNTVAGDFTDANFAPGYPPDGSEPAGETITGTAGDDILVGSVGADTIDALGGEDSVFGQAGADLIYGGDGLDNLNGGDGDDFIDGGNGDDSLSGDEGNDQMFGSAGNDNLFGGDGNDQLSGGDGFDNLSGDAGNDLITGGNHDDFLTGGEGDDSLDGGDGNDFLSGGLGSDVLTGGAGSDVFDFQLATNGPDTITDFATGTDQLQISASGFGGGLSEGGAVSLVSGSDPTATGMTGQFLYDTDDGRLFWDADGTGSDAPVLVATLTDLPSLAASDFVVVF